jgi:hypothetical protein
MGNPTSPFEKGLRLMGAQQQLAARSLINMIEMISTSTHRYAEQSSAFTREAMDLIGEASKTTDPAELARLQQQWAQTCLKYGQDQTRTSMQFVEHCGLQALNLVAPPLEDKDSK